MSFPEAAVHHDDNIYLYNGSGVVVPKRVHHVRVEPAVTVIPDGAFANCRFLTDIELPEGLQMIRNGAFRHCIKLARINIPSTVTEIGERAFHRCIQLEEIILPQGLEKMGRLAFSECCSLDKIIVPPRIQTVEEYAFSDCSRLRSIILSTGVREISRDAFQGCESLVSLDLPSSLEVIRRGSFSVLGLLALNLPDSVKRIEIDAFNGNDFLNLRVPPLVTEFDMDIFRGLQCIVSIELSEFVTRIISADEIMDCYYLRNIAFPVGCTVDKGILDQCHSLFDLNELQHRFDGLPVHEICYYHSYRDSATVTRSLKREMQKPIADKHQDCLGMTPLHVLACSTKHDLEMYQLLVGVQPEYLITEDKWGDIPLLYLFWCNAPDEIVQFMVDSYKAIHPRYEIRWGSMIFTMADALSPVPPIQNLLNTHRRCFPDQTFDMEALVLALAESARSVFWYKCRINRESFRFLVKFSIEERLDSLKNSRWRADLEEDIRLLPRQADTADKCARELYDKLNSFERIKEATSLLELALWKANLTDRCHKKTRIDNETRYRQKCHVNCGAETIIRNVLPYL